MTASDCTCGRAPRIGRDPMGGLHIDCEYCTGLGAEIVAGSIVDWNEQITDRLAMRELGED